MKLNTNIDRTAYLLVALLGFVFYLFILPHVHIYPWADEWEYVSFLRQTLSSKWVFLQHGDHFIPIQKVTQLYILKLSDFDFRAVVGFNYMISMAMSFIMFLLVRNYRGKGLTVYDLFIPLVIMNWGHGFSQWGFEFQFLSSIFFVSLYAYFIIKYETSDKLIFYRMAIMSLILSSLSGLNGLAFSTLLSFCLLGYFIVMQFWLNKFKYIELILLIMLNMSLWLLWSPASASRKAPNFESFSLFVFSLIKSSLVVYAFDWQNIKVMIISAIIIYLFYAVSTSINKLSLSDFVLVSVIFSSFVLLLALAWGRSSYQQGWSPGLEMHYGILTCLIPVFSWFYLSTKKYAGLIGFVLITLYFLGFVDNAKWRFNHIRQSASYITEIQNEIRDSKVSSTLVASKYIKDIHIDPSDSNIARRSDDIEFLRNSRLFLYDSNHK